MHTGDEGLLEVVSALLEIGDRIEGRFSIRDIRHGGMGTVYLCAPLNRDEDHSQSAGESAIRSDWAAIKTIRAEIYYTGNNSDLFQRELATVASLPPAAVSEGLLPKMMVGVPACCARRHRSGAASAGRSSRSAPSGHPRRRPAPARYD